MLPLSLLGGLPWRFIGAAAACVGLLATGAYAEHWRAGRAAAIQQAEELAQRLEAQQEAQRRRANLNTIEVITPRHGWLDKPFKVRGR